MALSGNFFASQVGRKREGDLNATMNEYFFLRVRIHFE